MSTHYKFELKEKWTRLNFANIAVPSRPTWPDNTRLADELIKRIVKDRATLPIRELLQHPLNEGVCLQLFASFIQDTWHGEFPPAMAPHDTTAIVDHVIEGREADVLDALTNQQVRNPRRLTVKLMNLASGARFLFGDDFVHHREHAFDVELILRLHSIIADGLLENAGQFRVRFASAAGTGVCFRPPNQIPVFLPVLMTFVEETRSSLNRDDRPAYTRDMFRLAALFFSEFLMLHPFSNCNGRSARLLLCYLLRDVTFVPFGFGDRNAYLDALAAGNGINVTPDRLASLIVQRASEAHDDMMYLLARPDLDEMKADSETKSRSS